MMWIVDFLVTALAYLLIPAIICLSRKRYSKKVIKVIIGINGFCVWLVFMIIRINAGVEGTSYAVLLWSFVAYWLMKKYCLELDEAADANMDGLLEYEELILADKKSTDSKLPKVDQRLSHKAVDVRKKKRKKQTLVTVLLLVLLIGSLLTNVIQCFLLLKEETELVEQEEDAVKYTVAEEYYSFEDHLKDEKLAFYDENIVFVIEGGSEYYTYNQMVYHMGGFDNPDIVYHAYDKKQARAMGYQTSPAGLTAEEYAESILEDKRAID